MLILLVLLLFLSGCGTIERTNSGTLVQFKQFVDKADLEYIADYEVTASGASYTMKQYFMGEDRIRTDLMIGDRSASTYILNKEVYSCALQNDWVCIKLEDKKLESVTELIKKIENNPESYVIVYDGKEKIIDTETYCFTIKMPEMLGIKMRECFSIEGVPLLLSSGSLMSMEATSYTLKVNEEMFILPAVPMTMEEFKAQEQVSLQDEIEQEREELLNEEKEDLIEQSLEEQIKNLKK